MAGSRTALHGRIVTWWRSSLQVRVVTITTFLGTVLTLLLGSVLFQQIADGLVDRRVASVQEDAQQQSRDAQTIFDQDDRPDAGDVDQLAIDVRNSLLPLGEDTARWAVLAPSQGDEAGEDPGLYRDYSTDPSLLTLDDVPVEVRESLLEEPGYQQVVVTQTPAGSTVDGETGPTVVVGTRVSAPVVGAYDLYFFYGLQAEEDTLALMLRLLLLGGVALVLILGGVSYLATRLVVEPVRTAARVSTQLAQGELDVRLPVRGTDELAALATSFNTMADSLQLTIRELQELSRLQQRFVSDVSHELRTPLTTMRMAGELLHAQRDEFGPTTARSTELLYQEMNRFEALLTDLLEISRFDAGAAVLDAERQDLLPVVQDVLAGHARLAERHGSALTLHAPPGPVEAEIDHRRVGRILRNLVGNALEHGEGRPVEVSVTPVPDDDTVRIDVRDHGIGLTAEQARQVFDRFWRADPSRDRTTGGTGLGLSIALEDANLHGGRLEVEGRPGDGATFRLVLPRSIPTALGHYPGEPPAPVVVEAPGDLPSLAGNPTRDTGGAQGPPAPEAADADSPHEPGAAGDPGYAATRSHPRTPS